MNLAWEVKERLKAVKKIRREKEPEGTEVQMAGQSCAGGGGRAVSSGEGSGPNSVQGECQHGSST